MIEVICIYRIKISPEIILQIRISFSLCHVLEYKNKNRLLDSINSNQHFTLAKSLMLFEAKKWDTCGRNQSTGASFPGSLMTVIDSWCSQMMSADWHGSQKPNVIGWKTPTAAHIVRVSSLLSARLLNDCVLDTGQSSPNEVIISPSCRG